MGYETHYSWTYYGSYFDHEPPDSNEAHVNCYESQSERERALTDSVSWLKPMKIIQK